MFVILHTLAWILVLALSYACFNMMKKLEKLEDRVADYFVRSTKILEDARKLDEREMFEKDDDVGILFVGLITLIGELRTIIYAEEEE
ncbi:MAG: hypothetical protein VW683_00300 [Betaproteobacteria bacterium]|jgi:preprotein translocase subunit Sss1